MERLSDYKERLYELLFITPFYKEILLELNPKEDNYQESSGDPGEDDFESHQVTRYQESDDFTHFKYLVANKLTVYGFCPECGKEVYLTSHKNKDLGDFFKSRELELYYDLNSVESVNRAYGEADLKARNLLYRFNMSFLDEASIFIRKFHCASPKEHAVEVMFKYNVSKGTLLKVGQYPSIYEFDNKARIYKKVMTKQDYMEFNKAIGLKAHGNGIGAFVYLRRILERLIDQKLKEKLTSEDYKGALREEFKKKIDIVKNELPEFLSNNKHLYSIMSIGLHSLEEEACLDYFETIKNAVVLILEEEDKRRKRERSMKELSVDLGKINGELKG